MSIHGPDENDHSSTPEESDQYSYGDFYFHLRDILRRIPNLTMRAYLPNSGGIKIVTNKNTANGCLRIVEGKNLREPDESELIYFTKDALDELGIDIGRMKTRGTAVYNPEETGVYRKIDKATLERIMKEPMPAEEKNAKKAG